MRVLPARILVAVAVLTLVACSDSSGEDPPSATVGTEAPTTTAADPYAVPAVIDEAYVNRVLAGLDAAVGEVVRLVVSTKSIPPEAIDRLKAIYGNPDRLQVELDLFQEDMRRGFAGYLAEPGKTRTVVSELLMAKPACIYARVSRDYSSIAAAPRSDLTTQWVAVVPAKTAPSFNPTGWAFIYNGFERDLRPPTNDPCAAF